MSNIKTIAEARMLAKMISAPYSNALLAAVDKIEEMDGTIESLHAEVASLKEEIGKSEMQNFDHETAIGQLNNDVSSLTQQLTALKEQNALLTQHADSVAVQEPEEIEYELWQEDIMVGAASGEGALDEIKHYAMLYEQDGPVTLYEVTKTKKLIDLSPTLDKEDE